MLKICSILLLLSCLILVGFKCQDQPDTNQNMPLVNQENTNTNESVVINENENVNAAVNENLNSSIGEPEINWKDIEGGKYLPALYYYQKDVPTYGGFACGPTALKTVLEFKKAINQESNKSILSIYEMIEEAGVTTNVWGDANVDNYFITGFGITDVALKKLAIKLGYEDTIIFGKSYDPNFPTSEAIDPEHKGQMISSEGWKAEIDEDGWDTAKLFQTVQQGYPVIVDVTVAMHPVYGPDDSRSYNPFYIQSGATRWELTFGKGHFMVAIGFQDWGTDNAKIILLDPLTPTDHPDNISIYTVDEFEKSWILLNNQGLLVD